ncbi:hypothetical protein ACLOJK_029035 [Asimina triloba]
MHSSHAQQPVQLLVFDFIVFYHPLIFNAAGPPDDLTARFPRARLFFLDAPPNMQYPSLSSDRAYIQPLRMHNFIAAPHALNGLDHPTVSQTNARPGSSARESASCPSTDGL